MPLGRPGAAQLASGARKGLGEREGQSGGQEHPRWVSGPQPHDASRRPSHADAELGGATGQSGPRLPAADDADGTAAPGLRTAGGRPCPGCCHVSGRPNPPKPPAGPVFCGGFLPGTQVTISLKYDRHAFTERLQLKPKSTQISQKGLKSGKNHLAFRSHATPIFRR